MKKSSVPALFATLLSLTAISAHADTITWVGGTAAINTAAQWSDGNAPAAGNDYVVSGSTALAEITGAAAPFTFAGDSLTVENGAGFWMQSSSNGTVTIPNLTVDSGVLYVVAPASGSLSYTLAVGVTFTGTDNLQIGRGGGSTHTLTLSNTVSGDGAINVLDGTESTNHSSILTLASTADLSGFTGDWSITGVNSSNRVGFTIQTTTGWGSGDITLNGYSTLTLSVSTTAITATSSDISLTTTDQFVIGSGTTTIGGLSFGGTQAANGTYLSSDLNTLFSTSDFSGTGTLIVVPEASTIALTVIFGAGILLFFRRLSTEAA